MTVIENRSPVSTRTNLTLVLYRSSGFAFLALTAFAVVAFWPRYLANPAGKDIRFHIHAAAMSAWCALLITQALLVRTGRRGWHRRLGVLGWILGPAVSVSILVLNHHQSQGRELTAFDLWSFTSNIGDATLFFACWLLAMRKRHTPVVHARYMVCTAITFIPPIFDRLFTRYAMTAPVASIMPTLGGEPFTVLASFIIVFLALGGLAWADLRSRTPSTVFAAMFVVFAVWYAAPLALMTSDRWRTVIAWYLSMPLS